MPNAKTARSTGQTLVVTRLNPGGVCHVGYVDARKSGCERSGAQTRGRKGAQFKCGVDDPEK